MAQPGGTQTSPQAGSQHGSQAGSKAGSANRAAGFPDWARSVCLDKDIRPLRDNAYDQLPALKKLQELHRKSFIVPNWVTNKKSPQCSPYCERMQCFREDVTIFDTKFPLTDYVHDQGDVKLSYEVEECLPFILHIVRQAIALRDSPIKAMESDRRHPVDTLGTLVWDFQSNEDVIYRTQQQLQIPGATHCPKPDACAFIPVPKNILSGIQEQMGPALSCFPSIGSADPQYRYAPHWVTGFKRDLNELASKRQVMEGLVSALYQRRALGFPNHLVFGTAYYNQTVLEVLAATWVPSDERAESGVDPTQEANVESPVLPAGQTNNAPESSLQAGDTTGDNPTTDKKVGDTNTHLTIEEIKKYNEIVVFRVDVYKMIYIESMLRLYLLMRQTRALALQYTDDLKGSRSLIAQLSKEAEDIYKWAPPPLPPSGGGRPTKRKRLNDGRSDLGRMPEEAEDMVLDGYYDDESDSRSDSEESASLSDAIPTHTVAGEVATYTVRNYAHETNIGACAVDDLYIAQPSVYQTT